MEARRHKRITYLFPLIFVFTILPVYRISASSVKKECKEWCGPFRMCDSGRCIPQSYYISDFEDLDNDGYPASEDCNEFDANINPSAPEVCEDLIDNDCDGFVDEGCSCVDGTTVKCGFAVGTCSAGVQICIDGKWTDCQMATMPVNEICDNRDNNCNGYIDDGLCPPGASCNSDGGCNFGITAMATSCTNPGETDERSCGVCGTQTRKCNADGTWSDWSTCVEAYDTDGDGVGDECDPSPYVKNFCAIALGDLSAGSTYEELSSASYKLSGFAGQKTFVESNPMTSTNYKVQGGFGAIALFNATQGTKTFSERIRRRCSGLCQNYKAATAVKLTDNGDDDNSPWITSYDNGSTKGFGIVWEDSTLSGGTIFFNKLDNNGTKMLSDKNITSGSASHSPTVVYFSSNDKFGIAYHSGSPAEVYYVQVDNNGNIVAGSSTNVSSTPKDSLYPKAVFNGTDVALTWIDYESGVIPNVYFAKVSPSGGLVPSTKMPLFSPANYTILESSIAWSGSGYGIVYSIDNPQKKVAVSILDDTPSILYNDKDMPDKNKSPYTLGNISIVSRVGGYAVVYSRNTGTYDKLIFALVTNKGAVLSSVDLSSMSTGNMRNPIMVYTGTEYAIAWEDDSEGNWEIYFLRMLSDGTLKGTVQNISNSSGSSLRPHMVYNSALKLYSVVYQDDSDGDNEIYFVNVGCLD